MSRALRKLRDRSPSAAAAWNGLSRPERRVLDALAWLEALGVPVADRRRVAAVAKYRPTSGGFGNLLGLLSSAGLIEYPGRGLVTLTGSGRSAATYPQTPPTPALLRDMAMAILDQPLRRVLGPILEAGKDGLTRIEVAEASGYSHTSGGFGNLLGKLRTLGFIDYRDGRVVPESILFP